MLAGLMFLAGHGNQPAFCWMGWVAGFREPASIGCAEMLAGLIFLDGLTNQPAFGTNRKNRNSLGGTNRENGILWEAPTEKMELFGRHQPRKWIYLGGTSRKNGIVWEAPTEKIGILWEACLMVLPTRRGDRIIETKIARNYHTVRFENFCNGRMTIPPNGQKRCSHFS